MTGLRILWALTAFGLGAAGLWLALRPTPEHPDRWKRGLLFYTNLSNLLVCLYHLAVAAALLFRLPLRAFLLAPVTEMSAALCIMVTFLVFHFMLAGHLELNRVQSGLLHYIVPLLTQAEWLLFAQKAGLTAASAFQWLVIPLAYTGFIALRAALAGPIPGSQTPWPYPFMDLQRLGPVRWLRNVALMLAAFALLGLCYVFIGRLLAAVL